MTEWIIVAGVLGTAALCVRFGIELAEYVAGEQRHQERLREAAEREGVS